MLQRIQNDVVASQELHIASLNIESAQLGAILTFKWPLQATQK